MISEKIYIFDTTLRDGQQTTGVDFSVNDKIAICNSLDQLGIDILRVDGQGPTKQIMIFSISLQN